MPTSFTYYTKFLARVLLAQNAGNRMNRTFGYDSTSNHRAFVGGNNSCLEESPQLHLTAALPRCNA